MAGARWSTAPTRPARRDDEVLLVFVRELGPLLGGSEAFGGLGGDLPTEPERALDGDALEAEGLVGEDLDLLAFGEVGVEAGDLGDLVGCDLLSLVAEGLAHLHPLVAGVDELDLAPALGALAVGEHPEVGGDAGVVEELVRQGDDGFEPVVLDDPAADLGLAGAGSPREERRAVEDDGEAAPAFFGRLHLGEHVLEEEEAAVVDPGQPGPEAPGEAPGLVLGADGRLRPSSTPRRRADWRACSRSAPPCGRRR